MLRNELADTQTGFLSVLLNSEESACSSHIVPEVQVMFPVSVCWQRPSVPLREVRKKKILISVSIS